jgi:hypothetical protein
MRRHALMALLLAPALALGACGDGDGTVRQAAKSDGDKLREYAKCMRANGVDMPDPSDGKVEIRASGGRAGEDKMKAAEAKCRHLMPNGGKPPKADPEQMAKMREESKCMRENGVPGFPDPDPTTGGIQIKGEKGGPLDPDSAAFKRAQKKCMSGGRKLDSNTGPDDGPGLSGKADE